ncbi:uncharacterized protein LOC131649694 [Vicia villosa]|uniref:uncharacterized protein LOC131649694 n=1 Tax=Vicia villosa TaxID=3911 RepID=UPI00273AA63D|nr:uncharacterized protein LOC131649694 [Vicia villosa]
MVEELETAGVIKDPYTIIGSTLNATSLRKMGLIQAIENAPQAIPGVRNRRGPILSEFEMFFLNEQPDIKVRYLNLLKQDGSIDAPIGVCKQKLPTTKDGIVEVFPKAASQKERRTKRKQDVPSISKEKRTEEKVAEENKVVIEKENKEKEDVVIKKKQKKNEKEDDMKNDEKEAEKKKKRKKTDKTDDEKKDEKVEEKKKKVPKPSQPEIQPEKASTKPPSTTKVLTPPSSPKTNPASEHPIAEPILDVLPHQTVFPPHSNISTSQPPPHSNYEPVASSVPLNPTASESLNSDSLKELFCAYSSSTRFKTPNPELSVGVSFEFLKLKVQTGLESLKVAHNARTDYVATRRL